MFKITGFPAILLLLLASFCVAQTGSSGEEKTQSVFRSHRLLGGLKVKLDKDFTLSTFGAVYLGDGPQYKVASRTDPYSYNGWDIVPGFSLEMGELFNGIKLSMGGDLYLLTRIFQKGEEEMFEYRPRWNVALTKPLSFGGSIQWTSRFERTMQEWYQFPYRTDANGDSTRVKELTQKRSVYRYRSALKLSAPKYTGYKISPYIYSESFNEREQIDFYSETELGVNFEPFKGISVSLADNFQLKYRADDIVKNHMLCLNAFYTLDLSGLSIFKN